MHNERDSTTEDIHEINDVVLNVRKMTHCHVTLFLLSLIYFSNDLSSSC